MIGKRVTVQIKPGRYISSTRKPGNGRIGTVLRENEFGRGTHEGGLWYVRLEATKRAKECVEMFCGADLISEV